MITNKTKSGRFQDSVLKKHILDIILLSIVTSGTILASPKWVIPIFTWIVPIAL